MGATSWVENFPGAITVCDRDGIVIAMNERSVQMFAADGGRALIGTSLFDCHPEPSRSKLRELLETPRTNTYTIEKDGVKKLVYQAPCMEGGVFRGIVELVLELPLDLPHFVRQG
ncbi:MAG TPA: PAS domain-containing protein [Anaeromyxobacter sp.]|nr:PAS domain-containing protein [Anaeromyxobacter sp.]